MATAWQVRTGSADDLDLVGPLWVAVHHRHAETMPELAPYVSDERTWSVRRELYEELLTKPHTLLLVAFVDDTPSVTAWRMCCRWTTPGFPTPG